MNPEALAEQLEKEPFVPLRLHLTDGRKVTIENPDVAVIANLAVHIFKVRRKGRTIADESFLVSLRHIVSIEQLTNGRRAARPKKPRGNEDA
jgi:hypothetical protein